jgi:PAS domain S-box-containing protein
MNKEKPRILVVDDQVQNRLLVVEYLEILDVIVDEAASGKECLEKLNKNEYLLVILDVQMPIMDGFKVLELMQQDPRLANIPVVFVSAVFDSEDYILKGIEKGAIDYIVKPINPSILKTKVQNFINLYEKQQTLDQLVRSLESINKRLQYSEKKLKRITQSARDAIILLDKDFKVKFWNRASNQIFGYSRYEVLFENFIDYTIAESSKDSFMEYIDLLQKGNGKSYLGSIRIIGKNKNNEEFPIELSLASFTEVSGEINYTVVIRDITKRIQMEKEALKTKELRESNRVMKEFMDSVSHEIRTPMNAILGISNMLTKYGAENLTSKQREGLEIINQSGARLLDLINDILDLSRIDANRASVNNEIIELDKFLATMHSMVLSLIGNRPIKFHIRKSSGVPNKIYSDQKKLNQILTNLLGNAAKFTRQGKIILFIHYVENKIYFEVSDTGVGIAEEYLESIFERFQQIDNSETKEFEGTGLGLNICKKLIILMGGEIRAESELGKGTVMKFYIPVLNLEEKVVEEGINTEKEHITNERIKEINVEAPLAIIIHDDEENLFWYANLLKTKGIESLPCNSSGEALQTINHYKPDLILLKIEMPKIHGASIITEISRDPELKNIPVIAISHVQELSIKETSEQFILLNEPVDEVMILKAIEDLNVKRN